MALIAFACWSYVNDFRNWPWTRTTGITRGTVHGIPIGAPKETIEAIVAARVTSGRFSSVEPLRAAERLPESDDWFVGLSSCNCWLELHFEENTLRSVSARQYSGPTE
ncbi:MAG TPA: hypothetical protein VGF28_14400 [Thermoanaerobaculia bacterium]